MGLLDLPAPLFSTIDGVLDPVLPSALRLLVWAFVGAIVSMELYRLLSPQARIAGLRSELEMAQRKVASFDGEFADAWPLIRRMLALAFRRIGAILPGTVIASLPVLTLILWLDGAYGHSFPPPGGTVAVTVAQPFTGQWQGSGPDVPHALVMDAGRVVLDQPVAAPVPVVAKRRWWNILAGNPAGYLDRRAPVDRIGMDLPAKEVLGVGPHWLRGWEPVFFAGIFVMALALKRARRIE